MISDRYRLLVWGAVMLLMAVIVVSAAGTGLAASDTVENGIQESEGLFSVSDSDVLAQEEEDEAPDHSDLIDEEDFNASAPAKTCEGCHEEAVTNAMDSAHFQWRGGVEDKVSLEGESLEGETLGKLDSLNNFCQGIRNNEKKCGSCHTGYELDASSDAYFQNEANMDCLACHADPAKYPIKTFKNPVDAQEDYTEDDLLAAAQSVGEPEKKNCLKCHANAGGGDQHKIGDLGMHDAHPSEERSVHMSSEGADLDCQSCHETEDHKIAGDSTHIFETENGDVSCTNCHTTGEHDNPKLNDHTDKVACQTCHVPEFARDISGNNESTMTKMDWDWSKVGQVDSKQKEKLDSGGVLVKAPHAGYMTFKKNVTPSYQWYNGSAERYYFEEDTATGDGPTVLAEPLGSKSGDAKIYPFKKMTGTQAVDEETDKLLPMNYMGSDDGLWANELYADGVNESEWNRVLGSEAAAYGLEYSGDRGWEETVMYLRINHEIPPANNALTCDNCHGEDGRMNWQSLGYEDDPRASDTNEQTPTATEQPQTGTETEAPDTATDTESPETATETEGQSGPGFGLVAAVIALIGAALLAVRRTE